MHGRTHTHTVVAVSVTRSPATHADNGHRDSHVRHGLDVARAQVDAGQPDQRAMGPGPRRDGRDRQAGGPRARVPNSAEAHRHWPEQLQGAGGRQHGPFEFHIAPSPGRTLRTPQLLSDVSRQEWRVRGWRVPTQRRPGATVAQKVRAVTTTTTTTLLPTAFAV